MLEKFIFDAVERERARRVEAERLQIARQHLHGRDSAILDRRDKFAARREGKVGAAPEAEALCISEVLDGRRAGRGHIDDAGIWERVLTPTPGTSLLRRLVFAANPLASRALGTPKLVQARCGEIGCQ